MRGQVPRSCRGPISIPRRGCPQRRAPATRPCGVPPVTATPSEAVAAARPADQTVAPTMSAGSERPRTSHGMTTAAAAHRGTRSSGAGGDERAHDLARRRRWRRRRSAGGPAARRRRAAGCGPAAARRAAATRRRRRRSPPRAQALRAVPARAGKAPASPTIPSSGASAGADQAIAAPRISSGGSTTARKTISAAPTRGDEPNVIAIERRGGGQHPAAAGHERRRGSRRPGRRRRRAARSRAAGRPSASAHQQAGADRRGGAGAPRRQLVGVLQRVRGDGAAVVGDVGQRLGERVGEVDQLAALVRVAGAACGRSPRTAPAAGRRAWCAAAGWTRPTRRSVAAGEPARIGLTPASAS